MRYGYFDDRRREYVIERPDTPAPWINYLGEGEYCAILSNNAGGYSFHKSPGQNRILRYRFNAVPWDRSGRYVYLRDLDGDFWTNSWSPVQKPLHRQKVTCRHGLGYTRIESRYKGIHSAVLYLVPADAPLEIWDLAVTNRSKATRTIDVFAYCEFAFPYFTGESALQAILYVSQTRLAAGIIGYTTPIPGWRFADRFFAATGPVESFDCSREEFIGPWRDESRPVAVESGRCGGSRGAGGNACGALHLRLTIEPGETVRTAFVLGEGKAEDAGAAARAAYTPERIDEELQRLKDHWDGRLDKLACRTPDGPMNSTVNVWNAYQAHVNFRWSRSASLIEAGLRDGLGYRDTLQDTLGVMHSAAGQVRRTIVDLLRGQASDGAVLHKVQPLTLQTGKGERPRPEEVYCDDHLWIPLALGAYVRETGDAAFLTERVDFLDQGSGTVYDHARRSLDFAMAHRGVHGLLNSLAADWNDALQLGGRGESVWASMQFCLACEELAALAGLLGREDDATLTRRWKGEMAALINEKAWDGQWYRRALMDDGSAVGSAGSAVARIWLNPQSWSVISGVADPDRGRAAMNAVHEHLASEFGIHLFAPPYDDPTLDLPGRVSYPPGLKENASIFCHTNPWAMIAETILRRGDRAMAYYQALLPGARNDRAERRRIEPYVYGQFVTGKWDANFGVAHNPWVTGTASWCYVAATQYILGVRPSLAGLVLDPCIPCSWDGFEVTRVFREATYRIRMKNPHGLSCGVRRLKVNRKAIEGNVIPVASAGRTVRVEAELEA